MRNILFYTVLIGTILLSPVLIVKNIIIHHLKQNRDHDADRQKEIDKTIKKVKKSIKNPATK